MPISPAEAADALRDVDAAEGRVHTATAYRHAAPHLVLWGAIWVAGYCFSGIVGTEASSWAWLPLVLAGAAGSFLLGLRANRDARAGSQLSPLAAPFATGMMALFFIACFIVFKPAEEAAYLVFPALVTGLIYVVLGLARLYRMMVVGGAMMVLALAGYLWLTPWLAFWIAGVGGGGLILGGLWLRSA